MLHAKIASAVIKVAKVQNSTRIPKVSIRTITPSSYIHQTIPFHSQRIKINYVSERLSTVASTIRGAELHRYLAFGVASQGKLSLPSNVHLQEIKSGRTGRPSNHRLVSNLAAQQSTSHIQNCVLHTTAPHSRILHPGEWIHVSLSRIFLTKNCSFYARSHPTSRLSTKYSALIQFITHIVYRSRSPLEGSTTKRSASLYSL